MPQAKRLPSPIALRAFEAAARHESFKRVAEELFVTPAAVSHQIKLLEQDLGRGLFTRNTREVRLTDTRCVLFDACHNAFGTILDAVARCSESDSRQAVTISMGPLIGARWISSRLPGFWACFPEIDLRLHHTALLSIHRLAVDFRISEMDLGIAWALATGPTSRVIICSPSARHPGSVRYFWTNTARSVHPKNCSALGCCTSATTSPVLTSSSLPGSPIRQSVAAR